MTSSSSPTVQLVASRRIRAGVLGRFCGRAGKLAVFDFSPVEAAVETFISVIIGFLVHKNNANWEIHLQLGPYVRKKKVGMELPGTPKMSDTSAASISFSGNFEKEGRWSSSLSKTGQPSAMSLHYGTGNSDTDVGVIDPLRKILFFREVLV